MPTTIETKVAEFGSHASTGSWFLSNESDIEDHPSLISYAHYLRQAWRELNLSGVLCVDGRPTVYLCASNRFSAEQKRECHRAVWNQGLVPLLIFLTPNAVEVHSAVKKPDKEPATNEFFENSPSSLIPSLDKIAETVESAKFVRSIETGIFFQDNSKFFPPGEAVDRCLVENLSYAAHRLKDAGWDISRGQALLGRTLFVSFLQARQFIKPSYYPDRTTSLLEILNRPHSEEAKRLLYREFFPRLQREFNGTMFDAVLEDEERDISKVHLDILRDFLSGHDMDSGQMTLGFWAYNFRFIPVETISAIYEEFMKDADLKKKQRDGAYYTPRHLAETTLHVALEGRYENAARWRILDPACGSGIFLVAMFNLVAEIWRRDNLGSRKKTKAQGLLEILQKQIRGVDKNLEACRITAFSLYLALFEKLQPIDVDEFKDNTQHQHFLPQLLWNAGMGAPGPGTSTVLQGDFLKDDLPIEGDFDLVIGNPPWDSRGDKQIALHFTKRSAKSLRNGGVCCLLLPSTILVNRHGTLDGDWFRDVTVEKIVQLADFRFVLFEATHPCFILRYAKAPPTIEHAVAYDTPKLNRFDRRTGVFIVEPDDQKFVEQRDVLESALLNNLQAIWSRKFWGTPRDEAFLRRLDFLPRLSESAAERKWGGGVGFQPYYPGVSPGTPKPLPPWKLSANYLPNDTNFPQLVLDNKNFTTLREGLEASVHQKKRIPASLTGLRRKPRLSLFTPPMVVFSNGFTKFAFSRYRVFFQDSLRSITGAEGDFDLLRFLTAVLGSRLMQYQAFHSGSSNGIGRDKLHLYESLNMPFPLPTHELAPPQGVDIISQAASIFKEDEHSTVGATTSERSQIESNAYDRLQPLVEAYFSVTETERILIEDTLTLWQPSIHRSSLDTYVPSLAFPELVDRKRYADTLARVLNARARKQGLKIYVEGMASKTLNLVLLTIVFAERGRAYSETEGEDELWRALNRIDRAARHSNGPFSYLRGFNYFEANRLHMLKPATMRNWCRTAALNDADAIFEHLARRQSA